MPARKIRLSSFAIVAVLGSIGSAAAQDYPLRPITLVVPFAAGGPTDAVARIIAEPMRASLGQAVIVENATGAAGTIGTGRVARAEPDGHTVVVGYWGTHVPEWSSLQSAI
jgi:tripartite-type tricarboxylate transporter receptor subunit TctC